MKDTHSSVPRCEPRQLHRAMVLALLVGMSGCDSPVEMPVERNPERAEPGMVRSATRIGHYPLIVSRVLLWWAGLSDVLPVEHGITLFRLEYWTTGIRGERTFGSALVALPRGTRLRGVVSYQHPTRTDRTNVPSAPSRAGLLAAIAFAGHGYVLVAPDYLGLGTSPGPHPYLHAASEAQAVIDLLRAARHFVRHQEREWPRTVFLTGFSQGGHASLAAQRALETDPIDDLRITASAPIAGVYNLPGIAFPFALEGHSERQAVYLGYLATAYTWIYGEPISSIIADAWTNELPGLFGGSLAGEEIASILPSDPTNLFRPEFLTGFSAGHESWFSRALAENSVHDWIPRAPVRFYYGSRDRDAPAGDTRSVVRQMDTKSGNVAAVNVGPTDHNATVFAAVPLVRDWFDQIAAAP